LANRGTQSLDLRDQLIARQHIEIIVHTTRGL
jgi:hypothetical protein